jgi:hypothetical protein
MKKGSRCFSNPSDDNSSSDYILTKKQTTIYADVLKQYPNNFIKHNGVNYNENFTLNGRCLGFSKSYELLTDIKRGRCFNSSDIPTLNSYEAWSGSLYSVNYSANSVNNVVDTSYNANNRNQIIFPMTQPAELADISWNGLYPGVTVDPSSVIFSPTCIENTWRNKLVDVSFNNTNYYIQGNKLSSDYNYRTSCCLIPTEDPDLGPIRGIGLFITGNSVVNNQSVGGGVWKNGIWNRLPNPFLSNDYYVTYGISTDNIIITGNIMNGTFNVGGYWLNEIWTTLPNPGTNLSYQSVGITVDGTIITGQYDAGVDINKISNYFAGYWTKLNDTWTWTTLSKPALLSSNVACTATNKIIYTGIYSNTTFNDNTQTYSTTPSIAGYWINNVWTTLPKPGFPGNRLYLANGISKDGTIITGFYATVTRLIGGYWKNSNNSWNWTALPQPRVDTPSYEAYGISEDGTLIAGLGRRANGTTVGGYWTNLNNIWTWETLRNPQPGTSYVALGIAIIILS